MEGKLIEAPPHPKGKLGFPKENPGLLKENLGFSKEKLGFPKENLDLITYGKPRISKRNIIFAVSHFPLVTSTRLLSSRISTNSSISGLRLRRQVSANPLGFQAHALRCTLRLRR